MYLILYLTYLFCALNLSSEEYFAKPLPDNNTSLLITKTSTLENNEEFQTSVSDRKSNVKKRPGVSVYPVLTTAAGVKYDVDVLDEEEEDIGKKNSSTVPRKGAGDPPPLNDTSVLLNSTNSTNITNDNLDITDSETKQQNGKVDPNINVTSQIDINSNKPDNNSVDKNIELNKQYKNESDLLDKNKNDSVLATVPTDNTSITETSTVYSDISNLHTFSNVPENSSADSITSSMQIESEPPRVSSKKPSTASAKDSTKTTSSTTIVAAIVLVVLVCSLVGYITYKRLYAYWNRRHYSRVDFLIDGLYEM